MLRYAALRAATQHQRILSMAKITGFLEYERHDRGYEKPEVRSHTWKEFVKPLPDV